MLKKVWMILLAAMLVSGLAFVSCIEEVAPVPTGFGPPPSNDVETVVFDMLTDEDIQGLSAGVITFGEDGDPSPIAPLVRAGADSHLTITAVVSSPVSLKIDTTAAGNWGAGLDLRYADFGFRAGDVITVTGEALTIASGGKMQFNNTPGSENAVGNVIDEEGEFEMTVTLTAGQVAQIQNANPAALRIEVGRGGSGNSVRIDNINVTGMRPADMITLATPTIAKTETGISWGAIAGASGYRIFDGDDVLDNVGAAAVSYNMYVNQDPGEYSLSIIALGVANVSHNSAKSNVIEFEVEDLGPVEIDITIDGSATTAEIKAAQAEVTVITDGYEVDILNGYGNGYAQFKVDFGADTLSDFEKVTFTFQGISGDAGWKSIFFAASATELSGYQSGLNGALSLGNQAYDNDGLSPIAVEITFAGTQADTLAGESELWFIVHLQSDPVEFKVTDIEFVK